MSGAVRITRLDASAADLRGLSGLRERRTSRHKSPEKEALVALVGAGPDTQAHKVVRWRRVDLQKEPKARFGLEVHERTVGHVSGEPRLSLPVSAFAASRRWPRPSPSKSGSRACPGTDRGRARIGQQGTLTRIWVKRGTRPRARKKKAREMIAGLFPRIYEASGLAVAAALTLAHVLHP